MTVADLERWGYRIAIFPSLLITPVVDVCERALTALASSGGRVSASPSRNPADLGDGPAALFRRVGADEWDRLRERYGALESHAAGSAGASAAAEGRA